MAALHDVLITSCLATRPSKPLDVPALNKAMVELAHQIAREPREILKHLTESALALTNADSAGVSLLEGEGSAAMFRWVAIAGAWSDLAGGCLPVNASPCLPVIEQNKVMLFYQPQDHYADLRGVQPPLKEVLLAPFQMGGRGVGTVWVVGQRDAVRFDSADVHVLMELAQFCGSAYRTLFGNASLSACPTGPA